MRTSKMERSNIPERIREEWESGDTLSALASKIDVSRGAISGHYMRNKSLHENFPLGGNANTDGEISWPMAPPLTDSEVRKLLPLLHKIAAHLEPNVQDREDLIQDTLENAIRNWPSYNANKKLSGWLSWRMRNVLSSRRKRAGIDTTEMTGRESCPAGQDSATDARIALAQLQDNRDDIILVRAATGENEKEIGAAFGISHQRVSQLMHRARDNFGKRIGYKRAA